MNQPVIIFSDLDGTLLDHFTYESTAALPVIKQLNAANVPIVLTTSKTLAEVLKIQADLDIKAPLIIENGAAIFIPKNTFKVQPKNTLSMGQYWVKSFCLPRQHWLEVIKDAPAKFKGLYQGFSTLKTEELAELTGLSMADADLAKNRQYGEPIHWRGDESSKQDFIEYLEKSDATVLFGGRFFHVCGSSDKGQALTWLTEHYQKNIGAYTISTIALGDGKNDIAMLEAASIAVQIRSPVHEFPVINKTENVIQTQEYGPAGWAEAIQHLLPEPLSSNSLSTKIYN
ncbi:HAD-IIB family hydrolase [Colwellia sp. UCD-KL20]|uniref:HAD-IIB family hydrolase n=1 Tax=Colwellia sp. UCD-KL20 TaxID=1917165 RepID=UPI0009703DF6|nr:HAD-IIB family hydrolase [Colwellia sp. UCD-KL20]